MKLNDLVNPKSHIISVLQLIIWIVAKKLHAKLEAPGSNPTSEVWVAPYLMYEISPGSYLM